MGFINWQNLKKYIRRGTDAEVARIGHVNAVYDALSGGGPLPERIVTTLSPEGGEPCTGDVVIQFDRGSNIGTDYVLTSTDIDENNFSLGIDVPYHELIGTINFPASNGDTPVFDIDFCNTISDNGASDWTLTYNVALDLFDLQFAGDPNTYREGIFTATRMLGSTTAITDNYQLIASTGFNGNNIRLRLVEPYTSPTGGPVKIQNVDLAGNAAALYVFNLKILKLLI